MLDKEVSQEVCSVDDMVCESLTVGCQSNEGGHCPRGIDTPDEIIVLGGGVSSNNSECECSSSTEVQESDSLVRQVVHQKVSPAVSGGYTVA